MAGGGVGPPSVSKNPQHLWAQLNWASPWVSAHSTGIHSGPWGAHGHLPPYLPGSCGVLVGAPVTLSHAQRKGGALYREETVLQGPWAVGCGHDYKCHGSGRLQETCPFHATPQRRSHTLMLLFGVSGKYPDKRELLWPQKPSATCSACQKV